MFYIKTDVFLCHIVSLYICLVNAQIKKHVLRKFEQQDFRESHLDVFQSRSHMECLSACGANDECSSYQYREETRQCRQFGNDFIYVELTGSVPETGWKYYFVIRGCMVKRENCPIHLGFIYNEQACFCFLYKSDQLIRESAKTYCETNGASIIRIDKGWKQFLIRTFLEATGTTDILIQGARDPGTSVYRYDDGSVIQYFNWDNGQPDETEGPDGEFFIRMKDEEQYRWNDVRASKDLSFVCQID